MLDRGDPYSQDFHWPPILAGDALGSGDFRRSPDGIRAHIADVHLVRMRSIPEVPQIWKLIASRLDAAD